ncbi:MAG: protein phosphatase [Chloroflexaceae bacterium]|nr:protein phosphatase [Chloroflexaceae bacterium]
MKPTVTSESSPLEVDFLTSDLLGRPGQIAMTMAPGKQDEEAEIIWKRDLQADLKRLREYYGINHLICLLEDEELHQLGIPELLRQAPAHGLITEHFPIADEGLPDSMAAFSALVERVVAALSAGKTVLIHCKGGRGRTGMLAAACLVKLGYSPEAAIAKVRQIRSGALSTVIKQDYVFRFYHASQPALTQDL